MKCLPIRQLPCEVNTIFSEYDRFLSFSSVHHAIRAEKLLGAAGIQVVAMPTPREVAISCGQCLLFRAANQETVLAILQNGQVEWSKLFKRQAGSYEEIADFTERMGEG